MIIIWNKINYLLHEIYLNNGICLKLKIDNLYFILLFNKIFIYNWKKYEWSEVVELAICGNGICYLNLETMKMRHSKRKF